jgi:hypothetical protein
MINSFNRKMAWLREALLSPLVSNMYFENRALDSALHKPLLWLNYVDDTFVAWPHGPDQLQNFLSPNRPTIQFTMEIKSVSVIPFSDVLVFRKETALTTKVYRKPINTG